MCISSEHFFLLKHREPKPPNNGHKICLVCKICFLFPVNVLARQLEDREIQMAILDTWTQGKQKPKAQRDKVYPYSSPSDTGTKAGTGDGPDTSKVDCKPRKGLWLYLNIPEKYMNNKALFVDVISRGFFPATFIIFNIVFWCMYHWMYWCKYRFVQYFFSVICTFHM